MRPMTASDSIELIRVPQLTDRAPYAYAAVASEVRRLVFTAGACPLDEDGATVAVGDVVSRHFGSHDVPSTLLGVAVLGYRDQLVEVEAVAALR